MHKPRRPRNPRYWPRMKVRGARRRDDAMWHFRAQVNRQAGQRILELMDAQEPDEQRFGTSIMKEDHAGH